MKEAFLNALQKGGATAVEIDGIPVVLHAAGDDLVLVHADLGEIAHENRDRVLADTAAADPSGPVDFTTPSLDSFMQV